MDLRYDNQIIVNPDMERAAKLVPLKPGMAKAAAAAGVKPASLLTRLGPNSRPVPKPAFELTAKKPDIKLGAGSAKKVAIKAKANKSATIPANQTAGEKKKMASAEKPVAAKGAKPRAVPVGARRTSEGKKVPVHGSSARAKVASHTGGQKPSPAIAKTQASQEPND